MRTRPSIAERQRRAANRRQDYARRLASPEWRTTPNGARFDISPTEYVQVFAQPDGTYSGSFLVATVQWRNVPFATEEEAKADVLATFAAIVGASDIGAQDRETD